jgi:hypothetical protein
MGGRVVSGTAEGVVNGVWDTRGEAPERSTMAGLTLSSGINGIFPMGTSVQARGEAQVAHCSRGRNGESGAGLQPRG